MSISQGKILIVDDVPTNLDLLSDYLEEAGFRVFIATNGEAALEEATQLLPDLILLDIMMPGIDGYEVCKRLKAIEKTKDIPVVFISAVSEAMDNAKAFDLGAADYITKPFHPAAIKARVKNHITLRKTILEMDLIIYKLKGALNEIKTLSGLIPICANCKKIRDDKGYWQQVEQYVKKYSDAEFSHSICPDCVGELYAEFQEVISKDH